MNFFISKEVIAVQLDRFWDKNSTNSKLKLQAIRLVMYGCLKNLNQFCAV
jgi:hypothetical protein